MSVRKTMEKALNSQRYFITISYQNKNKKEDLQHFWVTKDFPKNSLVPTLNHIRNEVIKKENLSDNVIKLPSLSNKNVPRHPG